MRVALLKSKGTPIHSYIIKLQIQVLIEHAAATRSMSELQHNRPFLFLKPCNEEADAQYHHNV